MINKPFILLPVFLFVHCAGFAQYLRHPKIVRASPYVFYTHQGGQQQALCFDASYKLNKVDTQVTTLLVAIHGIERNGELCFGYADDMIRSAKRRKETLVVAPEFPNEQDLDDNFLNRDYLYWENGHWKEGDLSSSLERRRQDVRMSSFAVMDSLIISVLAGNHFPHIKTVIVMGHSAGGQFVQRYSATTPLPTLFGSLHFRFVVMNPSSYMYPDANRPLGDSVYGIPDSSLCPDYNLYPKGIRRLNDYAQRMGADKIVSNMMNRDIVFLFGGEDISTEDPNLDKSCAADMEGRYRLERGMFFVTYLNTLPAYGSKKRYDIVPNSAHSDHDMINSEQARNLIFGP